ncbi:hypothetical protein ACTOWA_00140 [Herbaspirillum seropedicae]|uniref:hypothetical protein n=1 Tax=Herbaspirillum seropedicae TaxID=964 RepID=UPI003F8D894D
MALAEQAAPIRDLLDAGKNISRLADYMKRGVTPSKENLSKAQTWLHVAASKVEPHVAEVEAIDSLRLRPRGPGMKG